jgi:hypothetical protein
MTPRGDPVPGWMAVARYVSNQICEDRLEEFVSFKAGPFHGADQWRAAGERLPIPTVDPLVQ